MFPGAEFGHPVVRRAGLRLQTACKAEHGHRAERRGLAGFRVLLRFQPSEQLSRVRVVQMPDFFDRHFNGAHGDKLNRPAFARKSEFVDAEMSGGTRRNSGVPAYFTCTVLPVFAAS